METSRRAVQTSVNTSNCSVSGLGAMQGFRQKSDRIRLLYSKMLTPTAVLETG